ncbi:21930_t:CDS:2 [Dentiscutata erythropus]|uniref:21930_t:CDS:1 n=1 Tax=Dentiscutata erythropus TaxID=1348616 RepID=A0A9N8WQB6_9GLOM|nr:21930_t:CDS:2 [Dentiscutata erythropus]
MKEIKSCDIILTSPSLYLPSNTTSPLTIKGNIQINLSSPLKVTQVILKLHGFAQLNNSQKATTRNLTTKDLIKQKLTVVNITKTFNPGETSLPFAISLKAPVNLPASVEGKHAAIRYVLTAELTKASPHAIYKISKNVILRKNTLTNGVDINEKVIYEDEREGLLKYKVFVPKYMAIKDDAGEEGNADENTSEEPRGIIKVEATFESLDNAGVKEVKVEAFEYEMYNSAKFGTITGSAPASSTSKSSTPVKKSVTPTSRAGAKISAFSNVSIPNPHHTTPLLSPPLSIPISSEVSCPVSFEIPIHHRMKPDSNVSFLEIKHEIIMTIRFDKFMLTPLKLEVPISVITNPSEMM